MQLLFLEQQFPKLGLFCKVLILVTGILLLLGMQWLLSLVCLVFLPVVILLLVRDFLVLVAGKNECLEVVSGDASEEEVGVALLSHHHSNKVLEVVRYLHKKSLWSGGLAWMLLLLLFTAANPLICRASAVRIKPGN